MLRIAGAAVGLVTVLELTLLSALYAPPDARRPVVLLVLAGNLAVSLLVGYFVFNSISASRVGKASRREGGPGQGSASRAVGFLRDKGILSGSSRDREVENGDTLRIVHETLPYLRRGLNAETATKTARILARVAGVRGVAIGDRLTLLAYAGEDSGDPAWTERIGQILRQGVSSGRTRLVRLSGEDGGSATATALVSPLSCRGEVVGALVLVTPGDGRLPPALVRLAKVVSQLLAMQIELAELDRQTHLVTEAELKALRAQINPHFLFNTINTIVSYTRDDSEMTRRMLIRLADLFRSTMRSSGQMVTFYEEYNTLKSYLFLEQARFPDKLKVVYDIDPQVLKVRIPALCVQPIVENAVRHGIGPKDGPGTLRLGAYLDFLTLKVTVTVDDDGVGIPSEKYNELLAPGSGSPGRGLGLSNINERLKRLYGEKYSLRIDSRPGRGTRVRLSIPMS